MRSVLQKSRWDSLYRPGVFTDLKQILEPSATTKTLTTVSYTVLVATASHPPIKAK